MSQIRKAFNYAANEYDNYAFLQKEIASRVDDKLKFMSVKSQIILDLGAGTGSLTKLLMKRFSQAKCISLDFAQQALRHNLAQHKICGDAYQLPLADNSVDMVVSNLMLQWCDDLPLVFSESYRVLRGGGLMLFSTFAVDTLKELKKSWAVVDENPHVNTFPDMHEIGDKMLARGFQSPVMEAEVVTLTYQNVRDLLKELKAIGGQTVKNRTKTLMGKNKFQLMVQMYESYRTQGKLPATYEVVYGHAWKAEKALPAVAVETQTE